MDIREQASTAHRHVNELAFSFHEPPAQFLILTQRNLQTIIKYRPIDELSSTLRSNDERHLLVCHNSNQSSRLGTLHYIWH